MTLSETLIRFAHVSKYYGDRAVVKDFNLTVLRGELLTLIGSSGCGKTTVLKLINGLLLPERGAVFVDGKNTASTNLTALRRTVGYSIQHVGLFPHMTVFKNIAYVPCLFGKQDKQRLKDTVADLLRITGLSPDLLNRYPAELSGGQCQRVGIARALAGSPSILLMDEPFGALDAITRKTLQTEIRRIHRELGITILFVTHDIKEALALGTRVLVMNNGTVEQTGTPAEILRQPETAFVSRLTQDT